MGKYDAFVEAPTAAARKYDEFVDEPVAATAPVAAPAPTIGLPAPTPTNAPTAARPVPQPKDLIAVPDLSPNSPQRPTMNLGPIDVDKTWLDVQPAPVRAVGRMAQGIGDSFASLSVLPFVGGSVEAIDSGKMLLAARRVMRGEGTVEDADLLRKKAEESASRPGGMAYGIGAGISQLPAYAIEFAATAGAYTFAKKAAQKAAARAAGKAASRAATRAAVAVGSRAAGVAAQTLANPQMYIPDAIKNMTPELKTREDENGELQAILIDNADGFAEAFSKALAGTAIEIGSERSGGIIERIPMPAVKAAVIRRAARFPRVMGAIRALAPSDGTARAMAKIKSATAWNGLLGELFEEEVGKPMRAALAIDTPRDAETVEERMAATYENWLADFVVEGTTIAAFPVMARVAASRDQSDPDAEKRSNANIDRAYVAAQRGLYARELADQRRAERDNMEIVEPPLAAVPIIGVPDVPTTRVTLDYEGARREREAAERARQVPNPSQAAAPEEPVAAPPIAAPVVGIPIARDTTTPLDLLNNETAGKTTGESAGSLPAQVGSIPTPATNADPMRGTRDEFMAAQDAWRAEHRSGRMTTEELGRRIGSFVVTDREPSATRQQASGEPVESIASILRQYDETGELATVRDVADAVEALGTDDPRIADALRTYRQAADEDASEMGLRGDVEAYEGELLNALRGAAAPVAPDKATGRVETQLPTEIAAPAPSQPAPSAKPTIREKIEAKRQDATPVQDSRTANESETKATELMTPKERKADRAVEDDLMDALMDSDESDKQTKAAFGKAGYVEVDGFMVHPNVDPNWVRQLKPETKRTMREAGIFYIESESAAGAAGRVSEVQHGGRRLRGVGVKASLELGADMYANKDEVALHEVGHHVWNEMDESARDAWRRKPRRTEHGKRIERGENRLWKYDTSAASEEDFAQAFAEANGDVSSLGYIRQGDRYVLSPAATGEESSSVQSTDVPGARTGTAAPEAQPANETDATAPVAEREPWEMTYKEARAAVEDIAANSTPAEWRASPIVQALTPDSLEGRPDYFNLSKRHRKTIADAIEVGRTIPPAVLAEYPYLAPKPTLSAKLKEKQDEKTPTRPSREIIPYTPTLAIRNLSALKGGLGARYLEVIRGEDGELVAKQWRRSDKKGALLVDFGSGKKSDAAKQDAKQQAQPEKQKRQWPKFKQTPDTPLLNFIAEQGGIRSKSKAMRPGGEYDGQPPIGRLGGFARSILGGTIGPAEMAQLAFNSGALREPDANLLWQQIEDEIAGYRNKRAQDIKDDLDAQTESDEGYEAFAREELDRLIDAGEVYGPQTRVTWEKQDTQEFVVDTVVVPFEADLRARRFSYMILNRENGERFTVPGSELTLVEENADDDAFGVESEPRGDDRGSTPPATGGGTAAQGGAVEGRRDAERQDEGEAQAEPPAPGSVVRDELDRIVPGVAPTDRAFGILYNGTRDADESAMGIAYPGNRGMTLAEARKAFDEMTSGAESVYSATIIAYALGRARDPYVVRSFTQAIPEPMQVDDDEPDALTLEQQTPEDADAEREAKKRADEEKQKADDVAREAEERARRRSMPVDRGERDLFERQSIFDAPSLAEQERKAKRDAARSSAQAGESAQFAKGGDYAPSLVALHNLSADNLVHIEDLGGIAVPSIAITRPDIPFNSFGDITLVGNRAMVDPQGRYPVSVFDADAWTTRHPDVVWKKVPVSAAQKIIDRFRKAQNDADDHAVTNEVWDYLVNRPDKNRAADRMAKSDAVKLQFLRDNGKDVETPMREVSLRHHESLDPELREFIKSQGDALYSARPGDEKWAKFSEVLKRAIVRTAESVYADNDADVRKMMVDGSMEDMIDKDGMVYFGRFDSILRDQDKIGKREIDRGAMGDAIRAAMKSIPNADEKLNAYIADILRVYKPPMLRVRGRLEYYNLDNIVAAMTTLSVRGREEGMTFGEGKARGASAKSLRSVDEMHAAEGTLANEGALKKYVEEIQKPLMEQYRESAMKQRRDSSGSDTWETLDDSMKALSEYLKGGKVHRSVDRMRRALSRNGFKTDSGWFVDEALDAAHALANAPTEYFEAKPLRGVKLSEFSGAVVPNDASEKVIETLRKAGIQTIERYDKYNAEQRAAAVQKIAKQTDVMFARARFNMDSLALSEVTIEGQQARTGSPITFTFLRHKESAVNIHGKPAPDARFDRGYEPSGRYVNAAKSDALAREQPDKYESGTLTLARPIVMDGGEYGEPSSWKRSLSAAFGGLRGKRLSAAIIDAGYDGVITVATGRNGQRYATEILDLTTFDMNKARYSSDTDATPAPGITLSSFTSTLADETRGVWFAGEGVEGMNYADAPEAVRMAVERGEGQAAAALATETWEDAPRTGKQFDNGHMRIYSVVRHGRTLYETQLRWRHAWHTVQYADNLQEAAGIVINHPLYDSWVRWAKRQPWFKSIDVSGASVRSAMPDFVRGDEGYGLSQRVEFPIAAESGRDIVAFEQPRFYRSRNGQVRAVTIGRKSWFFLDRYESTDQLAGDIREEAGHRLVNELGGKPFVRAGQRAYGGRWMKIAGEIDRNYGYARGTPEWTHELIAKAFRDGQQNVSVWRKFVDALVAAVRDLARRMGVKLATSDAEIRAMLNTMLEAKARSVNTGAAMQQAQMAKASLRANESDDRIETDEVTGRPTRLLERPVSASASALINDELAALAERDARRIEAELALLPGRPNRLWADAHNLRLIGAGTEATAFATRDGAWVYKFYMPRPGRTYGMRAIPVVEGGKLRVDSYTATLAGLIERLAVQARVGGVPTELVGRMDAGAILVKQPAGTQPVSSDGIDEERLRMMAVEIPRDLMVDGARAWVTILNGAPYIITDLSDRNFASDAAGRARMIDSSIGRIPDSLLESVPALRRVVSEAEAMYSTRADTRGDVSFARSSRDNARSVDGAYAEILQELESLRAKRDAWAGTAATFGAQGERAKAQATLDRIVGAPASSPAPASAATPVREAFKAGQVKATNDIESEQRARLDAIANKGKVMPKLPKTWRGIVTEAARVGAEIERDKGRMVSTEYAVDRAIEYITRERRIKEADFLGYAYDKLAHVEAAAAMLTGEARDVAIADGLSDTFQTYNAMLMIRASNHNADRALAAVKRELQLRGKAKFLAALLKFRGDYQPNPAVPNPKLAKLTPDGMEAMKAWVKRVNSTRIEALAPDEMLALLREAQAIKAQSDFDQAMILRGQRMSAKDAADVLAKEIMAHRKSKADAEGKAPESVGLRGSYYSTSPTMARAAYGSTDSAGFELQHRGLWEAENAYKLDREQATRELDAFLASKGINAWRKLLMRVHAKKVKIGDTTYHMTDAHRLMLAATNARYIARVHLVRDGWKLDEQRGSTFQFSGADAVKDVLDTITPAEMEIVEKIREIQARLAAKGNAVSYRILGRALFMEDDYVVGMTPERLAARPTEVQLNSGWEATHRTLENAGFTKLPVEHSHPLIIGDIFSAFERHVDGMSRFINMTEPLRRLRQTLGSQESALRRVINERLGRDYTKHLDDMMAALAGYKEMQAMGKMRRVVSRATSNVARSYINMNPTTYMRNLGPGSILLQTWLANEHPKAAAWWTAHGIVPRSLHLGDAKKILAFAEANNGFFADRFKSTAEIIMAPIRETAVTTRSKLAVSQTWKNASRLLPLNPVNAEKRLVVTAVKALMASGMTMQQAVDEAARAVSETQNSTSDLYDSAFIREMRSWDLAGIGAFMSQSVVAGNLFAQYAAERKWSKAAGAALGLLLAHVVSYLITTSDRWLRKPDERERDRQKSRLMALASELSNAFAIISPMWSTVADPVVSAAMGMTVGDDLSLVGRPLMSAAGSVGSLINRAATGKDIPASTAQRIVEGGIVLTTGLPVTGAKRIFDYATVGRDKVSGTRPMTLDRAIDEATDTGREASMNGLYQAYTIGIEQAVASGLTRSDAKALPESAQRARYRAKFMSSVRARYGADEEKRLREFMAVMDE